MGEHVAILILLKSRALSIYQIGEDYTVAFTCDAVQDDPGSDDSIGFVGTATVNVSAGAVTVHDF